jgi:hypothetical protein
MKSDIGLADYPKRPSDSMGSTILAMPSLGTARRRHATRYAEPGPLNVHDAVKKNQFKIRLANMHDIRKEACMLIQERYAERGYGTQELAEDPRRLTIVAYEGSDAVGTLSVGFDSASGLLCDDLYRHEIDALRGADRKVCEFIKFAVNTSASSIKTLASLFHVAFIYAHRIHGCDDVVIEVNPHHVKFYERALGFTQIGLQRINRRVNAPAILLRGKFTYIGEQLRIFGGRAEERKREKSIFPYGFGEREEQDIQQRLDAMGIARLMAQRENAVER